MSEPLLISRDLTVRIDQRGGGFVTPVEGITFTVHRGESLGLVGESGSGKTLTLKAILGLLPVEAHVVSGEILLARLGHAPEPYDPEEARGRQIAMIFQEPSTALNPTMRVGDLIAEGAIVNLGLSKREAHKRAIDLMRKVGIPDPQRRAKAWPHQFSGGLRQRVMIAMALAGEPRLLLCDEPTTALDVTIQDQILSLLREVRDGFGVSLIYVTHDLAVIAEICDRVAVMYAGRIVEEGPVDEVFRRPQHPYTLALLRSAPQFERAAGRLVPIGGSPPDPHAFPPGCRFTPRCAFAREDCRVAPHRLTPIQGYRSTACIHPALLPKDVSA